MQEQELQEQCRSSERLEHRGSLFFTRPLHFPTQSGSLPRWEAPLDEGCNCACFFNPAGHTQLKATPKSRHKVHTVNHTKFQPTAQVRRVHYLSELRFALITSSESCTLRTVSSRPDTQLRSA